MNTQQEIKSFYIPRVYMDTTEQYVKYIFNMAGVGMPYRVDFTPCGKVSGFKEDTQYSIYKSAFVHFHLFYEGADSVISFVGLHAGMFQTIELEPYWRILKNRNPVMSTMMNRHQIVANCCILEEKVDKCSALEGRIAQLEGDREYYSDTFKFMSDRISSLENTIYSLADIVFDKITPNRLNTQDNDSESLDSHSLSTHSSMPSLELPYSEQLDVQDEEDSLGPTPSEIESAEYVFQDGEDIDDSSDEEYDESDLGFKYLNKAIKIVEARIKVVRENKKNARERIIATAELCGNE